MRKFGDTNWYKTELGLGILSGRNLSELYTELNKRYLSDSKPQDCSK